MVFTVTRKLFFKTLEQAYVINNCVVDLWFFFSFFFAKPWLYRQNISLTIDTFEKVTLKFSCLKFVCLHQNVLCRFSDIADVKVEKISEAIKNSKCDSLLTVRIPSYIMLNSV